ncbi:MAG: DNA polymerase III subunit epsilon [Gammaproteobacteria bacterium]|jgi:DNA polymerase-3 subunit epsilon|nr:DNA polymerase III subunit epsilon [Gammaproteobacteria bacterium]|tara:strand:+ start:231 stop:938 length:708 start_codon:yes stop_codon:yes gene_type:complete
MRQIVLDTETTGLEVAQGHRILEIGCVEIVGRRITQKQFHHYINPEREIDEGALRVHGISQEFLADKPLFGDIWKSFIDFVEGAELIIHNAAFDLGFIDNEMQLLAPGNGSILDHCSFVDSLELARNKHPGQKNSLDALCKRYNVDSSQRELHGALLDAEILADVYLLLTGGQATLGLGDEGQDSVTKSRKRVKRDRPPLKVILASEDELVRHSEKLDKLDAASESGCVWKQLET